MVNPTRRIGSHSLQGFLTPQLIKVLVNRFGYSDLFLRKYNNDFVEFIKRLVRVIKVLILTFLYGFIFSGIWYVQELSVLATIIRSTTNNTKQNFEKKKVVAVEWSPIAAARICLDRSQSIFQREQVRCYPFRSDYHIIHNYY